MSKYEIEVLSLTGSYLNDNGITQFIDYNEYLVRESTTKRPIAQFQQYGEALEYCQRLNERK